MNKELIINELKKYYNFKSDKEFADFLEVSPQTVSNWKKRNSIDCDLIFTKCVGINAGWLLSNGEGNMIENADLVNEPTEIYNTSEKKEISRLKKEIDTLIDIINNLNKQLK